MLWYINLLQVMGSVYRIAFSFDDDNSCDGVIEYDSKTDSCSVIVPSSGCNEFYTNKLINLLPYIYKNEGFTKGIRTVAIG